MSRCARRHPQSPEVVVACSLVVLLLLPLLLVLLLFLALLLLPVPRLSLLGIRVTDDNRHEICHPVLVAGLQARTLMF